MLHIKFFTKILKSNQINITVKANSLLWGSTNSVNHKHIWIINIAKLNYNKSIKDIESNFFY